ncbi:hypothetical protein NDA11_007968 [Ustilago hordei]|uniref:Uncharacterized protein n=1 Tax=Ustilago hordei TaxID=120017 RepID=I2G336_USTHO|nr:uncharacterized protein UHO2_02778 [Ustilago hordei]KAJ1040464.1 hypothetical protein NDA10_004720 [Ustilago hordei]KAJ1585077.1 hypothetical protein NDA15_002636 [Ustilago hordei]KAJ1588344.1 hypothetical protein NDA12_006502 [Ustilago hordei]KAJ1593372.1 hypothetical protein NDA11_007968 [Ustilago hordei]KAJ1601343.1 hypothetical protein NDA14_001516 [Ustilago hordei]
MSQPGTTEPMGSAAAGSEKPALLPTKASVDGEAEEGEIFDEEEGEISESRPSEPDGIVTPTQPESTKQDESSAQTSPKQPATPELPASKTLESESKVQDRPDATVTDAVDDAPKGAVPTTKQSDKPGESAPQEEQPPPGLSIASALEKFEENSAAQEQSAEQAGADATSSVPTPEPIAEFSQEAAKASEPQELGDPSTPKPARQEPSVPQAEAKSVESSTPQDAGSASQIETGEVPATASSMAPASAEQQTDITDEQAAAEAPKDDGPADMDVDEKAASPKQALTEELTQPTEAEPEPMQVDDSVHTPVLPSEGPETTVEAASEPFAKQATKNDEVAQEAAQMQTQVKTEPPSESYEEPRATATHEAEPGHSEPVELPQHKEEETAQTQESRPNEAVAAPESSAEDCHRSPQSQAVANTATFGVGRSEEVYARPAFEREEPPASRRTGSEAPPSRSLNRDSVAPPSAQEKRIVRTKEWSHQPSERSQDREQRAREKDRRREMERIERERERERERIRESEHDREMMIARENEESRLIWLSLPGNDHPQYYTDTDSDSCYNVGGALGVDLTDEEDKDLDPPLPLSLQEYHPAPSYSSTYYDDSYYVSKRKRIDDDLHATSRRYRRKTISKSTPGDHFASSSSRPTPCEALPSTSMIDIDDFPVPDSSIRSEPSERPFASRIERPSLSRISPYTRAEDGLEEYQSSDSDEEAMRIAEERKRRHGNRSGNRGNKLSREKGARWVRRGKLGGWTEMRMEKEIGDRLRHRVEAMQKDNVRALLSAMPEEDKAMLAQFPALGNGLIPSDTASNARRDARGELLPSDLSEAARIDAELGLDDLLAGPSGSRLQPAEHLTSTSLAPTLLKPAIKPRQLLTSHTLRHTFRNPHIAALGKTALDLIESEGVVGRAVGRCWAAMERGGWNEDPEPKGDEVEGAKDEELNGMDVDGSDVEGSTRHLNGDGAANGAASNLFGSAIDNPALSHLDKLFVTKQGLAIPRLDEMGQAIFVPPSPGTKAARAQAGMAEDAANEPVVETTLLPAPEQRSIVLAALECLHDLAADSREYVERLEEVRSRLAAVKRRRAQVWNAVRQWALDKDIEASQANGGGGGRLDAGLGSAAGAESALASAATAVANGSSPKKKK